MTQPQKVQAIVLRQGAAVPETGPVTDGFPVLLHPVLVAPFHSGPEPIAVVLLGEPLRYARNAAASCGLPDP